MLYYIFGQSGIYYVPTLLNVMTFSPPASLGGRSINRSFKCVHIFLQNRIQTVVHVVLPLGAHA